LIFPRKKQVLTDAVVTLPDVRGVAATVLPVMSVLDTQSIPRTFLVLLASHDCVLWVIFIVIFPSKETSFQVKDGGVQVKEHTYDHEMNKTSGRRIKA